MAVVHFDIDGSLIQTNVKQFPAMKPAWDRLKAGIEMSGLVIPDGFDWSQHTGETDLGVIYGILSQLNIPNSTIPNLTITILDNMYTYYVGQIEHDFNTANQQPLRSAVYKDVIPVLRTLQGNGHILKIITGNERRVTKAKLIYSELLPFFEEESYWFTGDMAFTRKKLLEMAFGQQLSHTPNQISFYYIADALKDIIAYHDIECSWVNMSPYNTSKVFIRFQNAGYIRTLPSGKVCCDMEGYPDIIQPNNNLVYFYRLHQIINYIH